jgi:hypothetical protein
VVYASLTTSVAVCFFVFSDDEFDDIDDRAEHPAIGKYEATSAATAYVINFLFIVIVCLHLH